MAISRETVTIGILAILFAVGGAYGVRTYLRSSTESAPEPEMLSIPVANTGLPADRVITGGDLAVVSMSLEKLKEQRPGAADMVLAEVKDIVGRRLREPVKQGSPILTSDLYLQGAGPNFAERLKPGFRAVSLRVRDFQTGTVTAGAFIDVLFRATPRKGDDRTAAIPEVTVTLLKNVEVLDVADAGSTNSGDVVTVAVPMAEVSVLRVVEDRGEFSLAVRPSDEIILLASSDTQMRTLEDVLDIEPLPPPPQPFRTAIYRRGEMHVNSFVSTYGGQMVAEAETGAASKSGCKTCGKKAEDANLIPTPDAGLGDPSGPTLAPPRSQTVPMSK